MEKGKELLNFSSFFSYVYCFGLSLTFGNDALYEEEKNICLCPWTKDSISPPACRAITYNSTKNIDNKRRRKESEDDWGRIMVENRNRRREKAVQGEVRSFLSQHFLNQSFLQGSDQPIATQSARETCARSIKNEISTYCIEPSRNKNHDSAFKQDLALDSNKTVLA